MGSLEVIGEEIVGVSLGVADHGWVKVGIVGHCLVMVEFDGRFVEVAVVVECWEEEEEVEGDWEEEEVVVSYLVGVEGSGGVGG